MPSWQLTEWQAFEQVEGPIGEVRSDFRMAMLATIIANANRNTKKKRTPFKLKEFMPEWDKPEPTDQEVMDKSRGMFQAIAEAWKKRKGKDK